MCIRGTGEFGPKSYTENINNILKDFELYQLFMRNFFIPNCPDVPIIHYRLFFNLIFFIHKNKIHKKELSIDKFYMNLSIIKT